MRNASNEQIVTSYISLRRAIGVLGLGLPIFLWVGGWFLDTTTQSSISHYYHSSVRDIFVGLLITISIFLIAYRGYGSKDFWCPKLAGVAGLGVAFFPTLSQPLECLAETPPELALTANNIHYGSAVVFFFSLAMVCLFFFTKSAPDEEPTPQKIQRNIVYRVCGVVILVCMAVIGAYFQFATTSCETMASIFPTVFTIEAIAVWAFGLSWLVKSEAILADR